MDVRVHGISPMVPIIGVREGICADPEHERNREVVSLRVIYHGRVPIVQELLCMVCGCRWKEQLL